MVRVANSELTDLGWAATGLCFLAAATEGISLTSFGLAAADISSELGIGKDGIGYLASATLLGLVFGALAGGRLADTYGSKRILVFSVAGFGLFSIGTALSTSFGMIFVTRLLTGLLLGGAMPNVIGVAASGGSAGSRVSRVALVVSGAPFGGVVTGIFGTTSWAATWQAIFIFGGVAPLLLTPLLALGLPNSHRTPNAGRPARSRSDSGAGAYVSGLFGGGRLLSTSMLWTGSFATQLILYLLLNWLPALMRASGFERKQAAVAMLLLNLGGMLGGIIFGQLMRGSRRWLVPLVAYAGAMLSLVALALLSKGLFVTYLSATLAGTCAIGGQLLLFGLAAEPYDLAFRGTGVGAMTAVGRAGSIFGPLFAGALLGAGFTSGTVLLALLPMALVAGVGATLLAKRLPAK
jgi:MFS transporter, AAHS family, 3-hydroxyphenylpropionic acid transporter